MQERRVTQRDIARVVGVTRPTVSLAFKYHASIPKTTRDRIFDAAKKLGYAPDPVLTALAAYRWPSSKRRSTASIAMIDLSYRKGRDMGAYDTPLRRGIVEHGEDLGFAVSLFRLSDYEGNLQHLVRVLRSRGITGVVLLPASHSMHLDPGVNWDGLAVVTATTSIVSPRFHQVVPNQLYNMMSLLDRLHQTGYRRIGAIFSETFEQRTTHAYSMALAWHGHRDRILILPSVTRALRDDRAVRAWLRRHRPALVIAPNSENITSLRYADTSVPVLANIETYVAQFPDLIGESAVRVLSGMIYNNETGVPEHPQITTIDGAIREPPLPGLPPLAKS